MNYLILLGLLSGVVSAQSTTTECSCLFSFTARPKVRTWTITGTSSCSRYQVEPTCSTWVVNAEPTPTAPAAHIEVRDVKERKKRQNASTTTSRSSSSSAPQAATTTAPSTSSSSSRSSSSSSSSSRSSSNPSASTTTAAPTTSSSSTRTTSSTTTTSCRPTPTASTGKRGLSYEFTKYTSLFSNSCGTTPSKVSWAYNWYSATSDPNKDPNPAPYNSVLEFVPMLWSGAPDLTGVWNTNVNKAIASGSKHVMAFNEPDLCDCPGCGSSCMPYDQAVGNYTRFVQPFQGRVKLGAPAVTNSGNTDMGLDYLRKFMARCTGCTFDFVPIHWYGGPGDVEAFKSYVQSAYTAGGNRPIWITEFSLDPNNPGITAAQQLAFAQAVLPWLDQQSYVERYALFTVRPNLLVSSDGNSLSSTGTYYNS